MTEQIFRFRPTARLLSQIGDQLIRNERIAVLELIKNSYDADSPFVKVEFAEADNPEKGSIKIYDEGEGMDSDIIRNKWLIPGTDSRKKQVDEKFKTKRFKRIPLGEKGIGRFAVQKLGRTTEITTRMKGKDEIFVRIDWKALEKYEFLDQVDVNVAVRPPEVFQGDKTGTQIVVRSLSYKWSDDMFKRFYETALNFNSPFDGGSEFKVEISCDNKDWYKGVHTIKEFIGDALFNFKIEIEGNSIKSFFYKFTPPKEMNKVSGRVITEHSEEIRKQLILQDPKGKKFDLGKYHIGKICFEGYIYDRDPGVFRMLTNEGPALKRYLNANGGIRVYRSGIRVYDYGEPGNDWLDLGSRRINQPTVRISNNIILAAVSLDREESGDLREKTNREGFLENEAYFAFKEAVAYAIGKVELERNIDKSIIRRVYGKKTKDVLDITSEFKQAVEEKVKDPPTREEFVAFLDRIEEGYTAIRETFVRSASSGLAIGIALHEIEKIIAELMAAVQQDKPYQVIRPMVKRISDLVEGYGYLLRKSHRVYQPLAPVIQAALFDVEYRMKVHGIKLNLGNTSTKRNPRFSRQMITGALLNIIDNAIWWIEYSGKKDKVLYIAVKETETHISVIIADSGTGFTLPVDMLGEPFVSAKPDGTGLGLHIVKTLMQVNSGSLEFPYSEDLGVPAECSDGAVIELRFTDLEVI